MIQLIYASSLAGADESVLAAILESSVRNNQKNDITGMLLYSEGSFFQVLEGDEPAVNETFNRLCTDRRHDKITEMTREHIDIRHFAQWSMGFRRLSESDAMAFPAYAPYFRYGFDASAIQAKPGFALEMLQLFSQRF